MNTITRMDIPIDSLKSPKTAIDVSSQKNMDRFMNTLNQTKAGSTPPDILVPYRLISVKKNKNFFMQIRLLNQEVVQSKQLKAH